MKTDYGYRRPELIDDGLVEAAAARAELIEPEIATALDTLRRVEQRTYAYHRELSYTKQVDEPSFAGFMYRWAAEETEHGRALSAVIAARGGIPSAGSIERDADAVLGEHRATMRRNALASRAFPASFFATHMTVGAINEWIAHFVYASLADLTSVAPLSDLLRALSRQESHHAGQYRLRAAATLENSRAARTFVKGYLSRTWDPVGADVVAHDEHEQVFTLVSQHDEWAGWVAKIDERVRRLPGLDRVAPVATLTGRFTEG